MGSKSGLGACAFIQLTAEAQTLKHHKPSDQSNQALDVRAVTRLPVPQIYLSRSKTLSSSSCHTAAAFTMCRSPFIPNRKHWSVSVSNCPNPMFCFHCEKKQKKGKKNPYQCLFPNVLLRFLFRGYERKPWQATVFHEVSKQGIPSRVWDLWEA